MMWSLEVGKNDDGRIYVDIFHVGRHRARLTSTGERPFKTFAEARKFGNAYIKRHR